MSRLLTFTHLLFVFVLRNKQLLIDTTTQIPMRSSAFYAFEIADCEINGHNFHACVWVCFVCKSVHGLEARSGVVSLMWMATFLFFENESRCGHLAYK